MSIFYNQLVCYYDHLRVDLDFRTILINSKQIVDFICGCYYLSRGRLIIDFCNYLFSGLYLLLAVGVLNYLISIFILTSINYPFVFKYYCVTEVEMLEGSFSDLAIFKSEIFYFQAQRCSCPELNLVCCDNKQSG